MINEPMLSTKEAAARYGGLLICGTNYALAKGDTPQPEKPFKPHAEYFTHESNRSKDSFVSRLIVWFDWWGIPLELEDGTPTELNHAISQTNLFYDSSASFELRPPDDMKLAYERLQKNLMRPDINASGLLVTSAQLLDETQRRLSLSETREAKGGSFWVLFGRSGTLRVAVCPHPSSGHQKRQDVEAVGADMRKWIAAVLQEQKIKQAAARREK